MSKSGLVNGHVDLESHDFAEGVLGEVLRANLEYSDLFVYIESLKEYGDD